MKIFISGSISIKKLDIDILKRIDVIIDKNYKIILGDARGVDLLVQEYLYKLKYKNAIIYSTNNPRNNLLGWKNKKIVSKYIKNARKYFTIKDIELTKDCDYGFVIWDEKSKGTHSNIKRLKDYRKPTLIYLNETKKFYINK